MTRLLRSEFRKAFSVKLWWGMLLGSMALAALGVIGTILTAGGTRTELPPLNFEATQHAVFASAAGADIFALVVGIILITTEYRHYTSRPTFLTEPRRGHVIVAKVVVAAVIGLIYAAATVATTVAISVPWFAAKGVTIEWSKFGIPTILIGAFAVVAIYAVLGLGIGVLVRNQISAVIGALAYLFVVEGLISILPYVKDVYQYLPGAAAAAVLQASRNPNATLLNQWQGGLVLVGWGVLFAVLGWLVSIRRDVA